LLARYSSDVYRPVTDAEIDFETRRMGKSKSGQKTTCAARSRGGLFPASDETTDSKSKTTSAQILRESISYVEHFSSGEKDGDGRTTSKSMRTALSANEEEAVQDLKPMDNSTCLKRELATVMKALETLSKFAD
jgi:hypothetical protein